MTQFGQFAFDPDAGTLTRNGAPVRLQPQPARVLALLVARAGEVVSRDELRQQIWGTETFVDFERGLNFCIAQIRSALGDSADSPRYIETLPKRGYRFIAPVTQSGSTPASSDGERTTGNGQRVLSARGLAIAVLLLLAIGAGVAALTLRGHAEAPIRIAVVPFDNETGTPTTTASPAASPTPRSPRLATPERIDRSQSSATPRSSAARAPSATSR